MSNGYIKLHRKILDNPVVMKSSDHLAVWMFLLLNATHKEYDVIYEGERITLQPGQLITGRKVISKQLKINESKIQRILKTFKIEQQIEQQTNPRCRLISVLNWSEYQQSEQVIEQQVNNKRTLNKNVKNIKNIYIDQFNEFWNLYDKKVSRAKAQSSYMSAIKKTDHDTIMSALTKQKVLWEGRDKAYIKHPTTWLNQECWNDNLDDLKKPDTKPKKRSFRSTGQGYYSAWCMKCGKKLYPNEFQLNQSSECCGVDMVPEDPKIDNTQEIKNMEEIYERLGMGN